MSGVVISVLSLEGRYYNCHERAQRERDNYDIVTRVIQLISPSQSCDNLFITYLCLYQALNRENTGTRHLRMRNLTDNCLGSIMSEFSVCQKFKMET